MASPGIKKTNNNSLIETNRLSDLPEGVKEKILTYLPIKEAGRTSILSTKWRYTWESIPELEFNELEFDDTDSISSFVEFVDTVLMLRSGPIRKFNLTTVNDTHKAFDRWIVSLPKNGIRDLTICLSSVRGGEYMMHSRFFSCEELMYINLTECSFKVPLEFKGFKLLHTIEINCATIFDKDLEKLISSCPVLKKLKLAYLKGCDVLNIRAPNLLKLEVIMVFKSFQLCAPKLLTLCVHMMHEDFLHRESILCNVPDLENFELKGYFLEYLCDEPLLEKLPITFNRLNNLDFIFDFGDEKEATFVLALFRGAPHLQSLNIEVFLSHQATTPNAKFWETVERRADLFQQLQTIKVVNFKAEDSVVSFVKFILGSAPQLVTLSLITTYEDQEEERMAFLQLLQFKRASPRAKIIFSSLLFC